QPDRLAPPLLHAARLAAAGQRVAIGADDLRPGRGGAAVARLGARYGPPSAVVAGADHAVGRFHRPYLPAANAALAVGTAFRPGAGRCVPAVSGAGTRPY